MTEWDDGYEIGFNEGIDVGYEDGCDSMKEDIIHYVTTLQDTGFSPDDILSKLLEFCEEKELS